MGDSSACLMQPFCYASGISNEANQCAFQSSPIHALGQSISFGRFMSEPLAWEKWSTFSSNRYVEEAERISRPGSVAQKKAFFEAHYKKLAAQKAAALLEQSNNATQTEQRDETVVDSTHNPNMTSPKSKHVDEEENAKVLNSEPDNAETSNLPQTNKVEGAQLEMEHQAFVGNSMLVEFQNRLEHVDAIKELSEKVSGPPPTKETLKLKQCSNSEQEVLQSNRRKFFKFTSTPNKSTAPGFFNRDNVAIPGSKKPKKRSTTNSLHNSFHFTPIKDINRLTASVMRKFENARVGAGSSKASKDILTPLRTKNKASKNELQTCSPATPLTKKKRNKMISPFIFSPISLRKEERTASRKKKLEERFNANEAQKVQLHTKLKEKAEIKIRKLRHSFCFNAKPLHDIYKEKEASKRETEKDLLTHPESPKQRRSLPPQGPSLKNNGTKNFKGNSSGTLTLSPNSNCSVIATHENTSPNIDNGNQNDRHCK